MTTTSDPETEKMTDPHTEPEPDFADDQDDEKGQEREQPTQAELETLDIQELFPEKPDRAIRWFKYIDPNLLWSPYPVRNPDAELRESVARFGIRKPLEVLENERDGRPYQLEDGQRRLMLSVEYYPGRKVPVICHAEADPYAGALTEAATAADNPAAELFFVEHLVGQGFSQKQIQTATRLRAGEFKKLLRLKALIPRLRDPFDRGEISVSIARACANLPTTTQDRLADLYESRVQDQDYHGPGLTQADVKSEREAQRQGAASQAGLGGDFTEGLDDADEFVSRDDLIEVVLLLLDEYAPGCDFEGGAGLSQDQREMIERVYLSIKPQR